MDDKNFDEIIKGKLEAYEDPDFDSSALTDFHERLSSIQYTPWYSRYRTEGFVGGLILFTLLNGFIVLYGINKKEKSTSELKGSLKNRVDSLTVAINQLKGKQQPVVFIVDPSHRQDMPLDEEKAPIKNQDLENRGSNPALHTSSKLHLGSVASLPPGIFDKLTDDGVLETIDGEAYLILSDKTKRIRHLSYLDDQIESGPDKKLVLSDETIKQIKKIEAPNDANLSHLSSQMINKIEAHQYKKGVGLNISSHFDLVSAAFTQGTGGITPRVGVTAEWVVAPHWSIETSLDYLSTNLTVQKNFQALHLVDLAPELGTLQGVEINTRTLSLPVGLKYRWWLTRKQQLIMGAGYTTYFSMNRQYLYKHPYPQRPADSDRTISTLEHTDDLKLYGGTVNIRLGLSTQLKRKNQFEADIFYERSLGSSVGNEKIGMQLYGIRTAFSFRVK